MRLAISNIAWKPSERESVYAILADQGVHGLEIAPAQAFAQRLLLLHVQVRVAHRRRSRPCRAIGGCRIGLHARDRTPASRARFDAITAVRGD